MTETMFDRPRFRSLSTLATASALALILSSCGGGEIQSSEEDTPSEETDLPDVGVIQEYELPEVPEIDETYRAAVFVAQQEQGDAISYTEAFADFGEEHGMEVDIYDAGGYSQVDNQISQIQTAMTTDPDIMVVWATDPNAVVPVLQQAHDEGIEVLNWVQPTNFEEAASSIHTDFVDDAYNLTTAIGAMLGGEGDIITAFGGCGGQYQRDLQEGAEQAAEETGLNIAINECPADFDPSRVQEIVDNALVANPDIQAVLTSVVSQSVGAVNAIQAAGLSDEVVVGSGILTSCSDIELVQTGDVPVVTGVPSVHMGHLGAAVSLLILEGEEFEEEYVIPGNVYTSDNIASADLTTDLTEQFMEDC